MMKTTKIVARKKKVTPSTISAARKKVMTKKPIRKMEDGGVKRARRKKEIIDVEGSTQLTRNRDGSRTYTFGEEDKDSVKGFKITKTKPLTGRTVEKTQTTADSYPYNTETRTKTVKDREGTVLKEKTKTFVVGRPIETYRTPLIKTSTPGYGPISKTVTKLKKNGNESQRTNNYPSGFGRVTLSSDKIRANKDLETLKNKGVIPNYKRGGKTKTAKKSMTPIMKKGGKVTKMKGGGMLKSVNPMSNPGLSKLPTEVRNKMGYKKKGGKVGTTKKK